MQLQLSDDAQHSTAPALRADAQRQAIAQSALELQAYFRSETGTNYSIADLENILYRCLDAVVEDWCADATEHVVRSHPFGWSKSEFNRLLAKITPCS